MPNPPRRRPPQPHLNAHNYPVGQWQGRLGQYWPTRVILQPHTLDHWLPHSPCCWQCPPSPPVMCHFPCVTALPPPCYCRAAAGTGLYELWKAGLYRNYHPDKLIDLVAR